ncbi:MAG: DUF3313 domain-containing protein [Deltaproteobacteria bacterium]|nr:DUF3313 domain-containing protein [Deltaproteobacteria bacterium]
MKMTRICKLAFMIMAVSGLCLGGCANSKQARSVDIGNAGILGDYSMLGEGNEDEAIRIYKNAHANWPGYLKIIIDPVIFQTPENASEKYVADLKKIATEFFNRLHEQLGQDYQLVTEPGPGTIRLQTALFNAKEKSVGRTVLSSVVPIGVGISVLKDAATGKPTAVGEISIEAKITDTRNGELLAAGIDRRVGQKYSSGTFDSWAEANEATDYWAKRVRFMLCKGRGGAGCIAP